MKRFYFSGDDDAGDEEDAEAEAFRFPPPEFLAMGQIESPFKHLMDCAIKICEKNFVWRFMSPVDKVNTIKTVFEGLATIEREYEKDAEIRDEM